MPNMIICCRGLGALRLRHRQQPCGHCSRMHVALCDWPTGEGQTCDLKLCAQHRAKQGGDVDYCPAHAAENAAKKGA